MDGSVLIKDKLSVLDEKILKLESEKLKTRSKYKYIWRSNYERIIDCNPKYHYFNLKESTVACIYNTFYHFAYIGDICDRLCDEIGTDMYFSYGTEYEHHDCSEYFCNDLGLLIRLAIFFNEGGIRLNNSKRHHSIDILRVRSVLKGRKIIPIYEDLIIKGQFRKLKSLIKQMEWVNTE